MIQTLYYLLVRMLVQKSMLEKQLRCTFLSHRQNAGQNSILKNVTKLIYLGTTPTEQTARRKNRRLNSGNSRYHSG